VTSDRQHPPESKKFWTTLPGVLTGVAALLTAVTGLVALVLTGPLAESRDQNVAQSRDAETVALNPSEGETSNTDRSASESDSVPTGRVRGAVVIDGRLEMKDGDWADLTSGTVGSGPTNYDYLLKLIDYGTREAPTLYSAKFARAEPSPTFDQCVTLLTKRQDSELDVSPNPQGEQIGPNDWFCLRDNPHQIASAKIEGVSIDPPTVSLSYTLWRTD
jgi:hypothetical protein